MSKLILVVDDDRVFNQILVDQIKDMSLAAIGATDWRSASEILLESEPDLIFLDLKLPDADTSKLVENLAPQFPVVILTGYGSIRNAVSLIQAGAVEYLTKPVGLDELEITIRRELENAELRQRNAFYRRQLASRRPGPMVGNSPPIQELLERSASHRARRRTCARRCRRGNAGARVPEPRHARAYRCATAHRRRVRGRPRRRCRPQVR